MSGNLLPHVGGSGGVLVALIDETSGVSTEITSAGALHVNLRDASGAEVSVGGGTQYDEDTVHVSGDKVTLIGVVRNDAGTALAADGDRTVLTVNASGALYVTGGGGGTEYTEDIAAPADPVAAALSLRRIDALAAIGVDGDWVTWNATSKGEAYVKHVDAIPVTDNGGNLSIDDGGNSITVDNAALSVVGGGAEATALRVTIANDSTGVLSVDDNGGSLTVDGTVTAAQATAADLNATVVGTGTFSVQVSSLPASTNTLEVVGDGAHAAAVAGNPVRIGAKAETALSGITLVADGNTTDLHAGVDGVLIVRNHCNLEDILTGVDTDTAGDSTAIIAAQGAGVRTYICWAVIKNTHATTDTYVDLRDGTAGAVKISLPAPAAGGGMFKFDPPIPFTANTAVAADPQAAVTTIITTVGGFKSKV